MSEEVFYTTLIMTDGKRRRKQSKKGGDTMDCAESPNGPEENNNIGPKNLPKAGPKGQARLCQRVS